ncbi:MAG: sigma-70 family RNA polymerase sigma factor [Litorivicinaceae bacterium]|jgi:RNA polymerase sigma-70 factor, ECF subfamily|nr:sigma-70 family RNA polymerase sigma factor [Litorivicinaceae bacterium]MDP5330929.1 sigma-70 family RNA polymerase sigma factor [Litorivicinaceae bacterium]MDP5342171.1 sigma-70 family RNA polymerase sigma factor [Litorivicinaceae bacterium]MDP5344103.1 sigma-70 family RNA polymerase sigma factor [Litorivicinaceae bacterium]MDP5363647.1 sigma-70 family RNA polymerase sigma factor [Litorivicinaceae bacterium]
MSAVSQSDPAKDLKNDQLLVDRAKSGDRHAFDLLVLKYQSRILSLVTRILSNPSDALDVVQETFVKAYRSLESFRGESAFYTWLYRIAVNTAKNYASASAKLQLDVSMESMVGGTDHLPSFQDSGSPDQQSATDQLQAAILEAIEQLPDDLCQALTLRELEGMSYEDIAERMDCPIGTVRSRIFRARESVVNQIQAQFPGTYVS